jgi:hypothetical protein
VAALSTAGLSRELEKTLEDIERAAAGDSGTTTAESEVKEKSKRPKAQKQAPAGGWLL